MSAGDKYDVGPDRLTFSAEERAAVNRARLGLEEARRRHRPGSYLALDELAVLVELAETAGRHRTRELERLIRELDRLDPHHQETP